MFNSAFAKEMATFLELRKSSVSLQTFAHDTATLTKLDRHLVEHDYPPKRSIRGNSFYMDTDTQREKQDRV